MKPLWFTVAVLAAALAMALVAFPSLAEEPPTEATPTTEPATSQTTPPEVESPILLKPKSNQEVPATDSHEPPRLGLGISVLGHTPLLKENTFDARFKAIGVTGLLSLPLTQIRHRLYLHVEGGFGVSLSRFVPTVGTSYSHMFFDFPVRLRLLYPLNDSGLTGEIFVGTVLRFFQYNDDLTLNNGPLFRVESEVFQPDFALGLAIPLSRNFRARILAGYIYVSAGLELTFDKNP